MQVRVGDVITLLRASGTCTCTAGRMSVPPTTPCRHLCALYMCAGTQPSYKVYATRTCPRLCGQRLEVRATGSSALIIAQRAATRPLVPVLHTRSLAA